jgi:uncharacterized protein YeaO (DUF488 family)
MGGEGNTFRRVLVDRIWPRGLRKDAAHLDRWAKDVAPSAELRTWYGHDPAKFGEFRHRYAAELAEPGRREALDQTGGADLAGVVASSELHDPVLRYRAGPAVTDSS